MPVAVTYCRKTMQGYVAWSKTSVAFYEVNAPKGTSPYLKSWLQQRVNQMDMGNATKYCHFIKTNLGYLRADGIIVKKLKNITNNLIFNK